MTSQPEQRTLSRGDIENLCIVSAIPDDGCAWRDLAARLGLSPLVVASIAEAMVHLIAAGWIQNLDGRVEVTGPGRTWAEGRVAALT